MNPDALTGRFVERLDATVEDAFGLLTVDVPRERWVAAAELARDDPDLDLRFFDWLSAYDVLEDGFAVVMHVASVSHRHHLLLRTGCPRQDASVPSLTGVYAGAGWHERETWEMFGIDFSGHPRLVPLLLPDDFAGHPLRKEFVLAARVAKPWPGAKEPGESHTGGPGRRPMRPLGVPDSWGPHVNRPEPS